MNTTSEAEALVAEYRRGDSLSQISTRRRMSKATVWRTLTRLGCQMRATGAARRYALDESAFDAASEASAYWVGFLMADGCVTWQNGSAHVNLDASETDADHVLAYRRFLGASHPVRVTTDSRHPDRKRMHRLTVTSTRLADALERFGVTPRKTLTAEVRHLEGDRHFWRGVVDGDGCVSLVNFSGGRQVAFLGLTGSPRLGQQFADFVEASAGGRPPVRAKHAVCEVRLNGCFAARMLRVLYEGCGVSLERKRSLAVRAWEMEEARAAERQSERAAAKARTCGVPDCSRKHLARGLCASHYVLWRRSGGTRFRPA